jgi:hypothetical protein
MDLSTILGFVLGLGLIAWSMMHGGGLAGLALFVHVPAFMVVFGGSLAAVMIHFRIERREDAREGDAALLPVPAPVAHGRRSIASSRTPTWRARRASWRWSRSCARWTTSSSPRAFSW